MPDPLDLDHLEALALAAQAVAPGEWRARETCGMWWADYGGETDDERRGLDDVDDRALWEYVAAVQPTTVLALVARVREAEAETERLRADLAACPCGDGGHRPAG